MRGQKAAPDEIAQEFRADPLVFRGRLDEPQNPFLARARHAEGDHELIAREGLAVEKEHQPLPIVEPPPLHGFQGARAALDEAARHTRLGEPERLGHRLRGALVIATRQPAQHAPEEPEVQCARRTL